MCELFIEYLSSALSAICDGANACVGRGLERDIGIHYSSPHSRKSTNQTKPSVFGMPYVLAIICQMDVRKRTQ